MLGNLELAGWMVRCGRQLQCQHMHRDRFMLERAAFRGVGWVPDICRGWTGERFAVDGSASTYTTTGRQYIHCLNEWCGVGSGVLGSATMPHRACTPNEIKSDPTVPKK